MPQWHLAAAITDEIPHSPCSPGLEQVSAHGLFREFICQDAEHMQSVIKVLGWLFPIASRRRETIPSEFHVSAAKL